MTRMMTTNQKKNTMTPGIAYPPTVLDLATVASYPPPPDLFHVSANGVFAARIPQESRKNKE